MLDKQRGYAVVVAKNWAKYEWDFWNQMYVRTVVREMNDWLFKYLDIESLFGRISK